MWVQAKVWDHSQGSLTCLGGTESSRQVHREGWEETAGRARGCRKTGFIPNINIFTSCHSQPNSGFSSQFHLASSNSSISGNLSKIQILRLYLGPNDRETRRGGHSNWCFTSGLPGDSEAQQSLRTVEQSGPCSFGHLHISGQLLSSASQFTRRQIISKNYNFLPLLPLSLGNSWGIILKQSPQGHPPTPQQNQSHRKPFCHRSYFLSVGVMLPFTAVLSAAWMEVDPVSCGRKHKPSGRSA